MSGLSSLIFAIMPFLILGTLFIAGIVKLVMYTSGKSVFTPKQSTRKLLLIEFAILIGSVISTVFQHLLFAIPIRTFWISILVEMILMFGIAYLLYAKFLRKPTKGEAHIPEASVRKQLVNLACTFLVWTIVIELPINALQSLFQYFLYQ